MNTAEVEVPVYLNIFKHIEPFLQEWTLIRISRNHMNIIFFISRIITFIVFSVYTLITYVFLFQVQTRAWPWSTLTHIGGVFFVLELGEGQSYSSISGIFYLKNSSINCIGEYIRLVLIHNSFCRRSCPLTPM